MRQKNSYMRRENKWFLAGDGMEQLNEALEELKRVDHLIYVSLKYTRTVDVIQNILSRMVDAYSLMVDALLEFAREKGKLANDPESAVERAEAVRDVYTENTLVTDNMGLYLLLRKLLRARSVERENEYRRHVTMKTIVEGREEIVNIDIITNYFLFQREFLIHVKNIVEGEVEVPLHENNQRIPDEPEWMRAPEPAQHKQPEEPSQKSRFSAKTPPRKQQVKVRPITSSPRKRTPRPKKYKIQIPKQDDPIMRPPYEHDPKYNPELRKSAENTATQKVKKTVKRIKRTVARKTVKGPKKPAGSAKTPKKKKAVKAKKNSPKKTVKKTAKKAGKKAPKKTSGKGTKSSRKPVKKTTRKAVKKPSPKKALKGKKPSKAPARKSLKKKQEKTGKKGAKSAKKRKR